MKIAFDVDGVVLRSIEIILDYINKKEGRDLRADRLTMWELEPIGLDLETLREAVHHMYTRTGVEPYGGAVDVLSRIHRITGEPLLFITGRANPETAQRQLEALPWNPTMPEMIVSGGKRDKRDYLVESSVDFIVEDDVRYLKDYLEAGFGVGLMLRPWNRRAGVDATERFESWADVEQWFLSIWHKS
ncbi:MAG TPA: hypothetical protein VMC85_13630 [Desulfomonilaceae bacterium]|nr:hypothetical protein [Desulfomonilaceae bacterium]